METFYGVVEFDTPIHCTKETLGSRRPVLVGGVSGTLELPSPPGWGADKPDDPLRVPLTAPVAASWKQGEQPMHWGSPTHFPNGWGRVEKALLTFELPPDEMSTLAASIHRGFAHWYKLFEQYLELLTRQRSFPRIEMEAYPSQLDLFRWGRDGKAERSYEREPHAVTVFTSSTDEHHLKPLQFEQICEMASSLREPALPYRIQLEAYRAAWSGDYRKALIETGSAAELGLASAARELLTRSGIGYADELMKRFQALGGKFELARMVGVPLPQSDYQRRLVTPRNGVIHRGEFAERSVALDAVRVTDELLGAICPSLQETL